MILELARIPKAEKTEERAPHDDGFKARIRGLLYEEQVRTLSRVEKIVVVTASVVGDLKDLVTMAKWKD